MVNLEGKLLQHKIIASLFVMENSKSQISSTSYFSNSVISEPPDIKQWFSSYNYQSPELDTNEKDLCFSHGVVDEERGLYVEDSETQDEENGEDLSKQYRFINSKSIEEARQHEGSSLPGVEVIPTYPDSVSMPSEPPDITNWFSSYVYESPELDSADFDVSLSSDCTFGKNKEIDKGKEDNLNSAPVIEVRDETLSCRGTNSRFIGVEDVKTPSTFKESGSERRHLSPENDLYPARTYKETNFGAELNNWNKIQDRSFDNPRIKSEDTTPAIIKEQQMSNKEHLRSPEKTPVSTGDGFTRAGEEKTITTKCVTDECDSGWISLKHKPREEHQVTTLKSKVKPIANKENSLVKPVCSTDRRKVERLRREILKETTKINLPYVPEVSGKWKCPQKYKPDTGPPMKQLRLEKWFHR